MTHPRIPFLLLERDMAQRVLGQLVAPSVVASMRHWSDGELARHLADGSLASIHLSDGTVLIPAIQFERGKARPGHIVLAAQKAFADLDPTGVLGISWLLHAHSPFGFTWRDLASLCHDPDAQDALLTLAQRDAARVATLAPDVVRR